MAPEIVEGKRNYSGPHVDVWSLGVALATMLTGHLPFQGAGDTELKRKIMRGNFSLPDHISSDARELLRAMLCTDPHRRISLESIKEHPWLAAHASMPTGAAPPRSRRPSGELEEEPLDASVLKSLGELGFDVAEVERSVHGQAYNHEAACYEMLLGAAANTARAAKKDRLF